MVRKNGSKNKNHIEYICQECLKNFGCRKADYLKHSNNKKPCKKKNNIDEIEKMKNELEDNDNDKKDIDENNLFNNKELIIKKQNILNDIKVVTNENKILIINNNELDNKNIIIDLISKMNFIVKQNNELKNDLLTSTLKQSSELTSDAGITASQLIDSNKIISTMASKAGITALDAVILIDSKKGGNNSGTWIHPDLAIQLAQWISSKFSIQVSPMD